MLRRAKTAAQAPRYLSRRGVTKGQIVSGRKRCRQVDEAEASMLAAKAERLMAVDVDVDIFPDFVAFI